MIKTFIVAALALTLAMPLTSQRAQAMDSDLRLILISSAYGAAGGAALGVVSWPLTGSAKSIFIGAAMGLYLGAAIGVYHVNHRDDPENPLRGDPPTQDQAVYQGKLVPEEQDVALLRVQYPVLRF